MATDLFKLEQETKEIISLVLGLPVSDIVLSADFRRVYKVDSLDIMMLAQILDARYDIQLKDEELPTIKNGYDILNILKDRRG